MTTVISDFSSLMPYLDGQKFNENYNIKYQSKGAVTYRSDFIKETCTSKRVLHVGCTDHVPLIASKIANKDWLHGIITECASFTLGVDIDTQAVIEASKISGLTNMISGDITSPTKLLEISENDFDIAVFGEVVEHISNPVDFLSSFLKNYRKNFKRIIITVPNAFRAGNLRGVIKNFEQINTDHRFFFTPYTVSKIAVDAGFAPESVNMATFTRAGRFKSWILNHRPLLAEDIILIARHKS